LQLRFIADAHVNTLYEAVIEATETAVLNAMLCSSGMTGRDGRVAAALPQDLVVELLAQGREIHACH
jgi:L-aminopeptidase/D-esterase-like protein